MAIGEKQHATGKTADEHRARCLKLWNKRVSFERGLISLHEWQRLDGAFCSTYARLIGRSFFTVIDMKFGLGPRDIQVDDVICVLDGCRLPVILRKDGSDRCYTFIGPAYVDGAMNGEFV
jgi:hypothetical protein